MKSIRAYLVLRLLVLIGLIGAAAAWTLYGAMRDRLVEEFDRTVKAKGRALGAHVERHADWIEFDLPPGALREFEGGDEPEYFQVRLLDGTTVARSATLGSRDLPFAFDPGGAAKSFDLDLLDGRPGRATGVVVAVRVDGDVDTGEDADASRLLTKLDAASGGEVAVVVVAKSRAPLDQALGDIRSAFLAAALAMGVAVVGAVLLTVRGGLVALRTLAERAREIGAESLDRRVPTAGQPAETAAVSHALNDLLGRLQAAFERERRLTSNIAHELRTSVAELGAAADIAEKWPDDPEIAGGLFAAARDTSRRMRRIVEGLLHLARVESGRERVRIGPLRLDEVVAESTDAVRAAAERRDIRFVLDHDPVTAHTDRALVGLVAADLVDNAVAHASAACSVVSSLRGETGGVRWTLANPAANVRPDDLSRLGEPFWRDDLARTDREHSGLGLAFAKAVAARLGGDLTFEVDAGRFIASLFIPHRTSGEPEPC